MTVASCWEGWVRLGHTALTAHLRGTEATVEEIGIVLSGPTDGPSPPTADRWRDVTDALATWPASRGARDWTRHPTFPPRGTAFQRRVWQALCELEPGETVGYGELARRIGHPRAARAIGQAVGANPWAPLVPCHRVLAGDGSVGGYSGGLGAKRALLSLEGIEVD